MKKPVLAILGIAALGVGTFATTYMQVVTKNGDKVFYPVDDVSEVNFIENAIVPQDTISVPQDTIPAPQDTTPVSDHEYVDLGLPSGTLWATENIGDDYLYASCGEWYAWGDTVPMPKHLFYRESYKWNDGNGKMSKYNPNVDTLTTLLPEDDAATANWGSEWRMPTKEEYQELLDYCKLTKSGLFGTFTGPNGNTVQFPAAGHYVGNRFYLHNEYGLYWTSSLKPNCDNKAYYMIFNENKGNIIYDVETFEGLSVRAVRVKKAEHTLYTVNFYTSDSILIESQKVVKGAFTKPVDAPYKIGYEFVGWSAPTDSVVSDLSVYALYKENEVVEHEYVDLGLPSGTLWATSNIGASNTNEFGLKFAWGEIVPKKVYDWESYKWATTIWDEKFDYWEVDSITKYYNGDLYKGIIDSLTTLLPEDDAATAHWGDEWRMPTKEELDELIKNCTYTRTDTSAYFTGVNGNTLFFPIKEGGISYWSSSLNEGSEVVDFRLRLYSAEWFHTIYREEGNLVRAVRVQKAERITYTVSFYTSDSILIESQKVEEGSTAKEVEAPAKDGYEFTGWSAPTDSVVSDLSVYALYKEIIPEHEYIDLGLPSGTLWATDNVFDESASGFLNNYFAWGETSAKKDFYRDSYKWNDGNGNMTKYSPDVDSLTTLLPEDDIATVHWGAEWRMPTAEEYRELVEYCRYQKIAYMGKFIGPNGNILDFIASGHMVDNRFFFNEKQGRYWSSSIDGTEANLLVFYDEGVGVIPGGVYEGLTVRPVRVKKAEHTLYTVNFYTSDSILIASKKVVEGTSVVKMVEAPEKEGYEFIAWSDSLKNVSSDLSVYPIYNKLDESEFPYHKYVDLGLPSGTLWATYDIGSSRPEVIGDYFAWGETETKSAYNWGTYKWCTAKYDEKRKTWELDSLTKYNTGEKHPGVIDSLTTLLPEDDAATANWGENWRMPTIDEIKELMKECRHNLTDYGVTFIGTNGNTIFFPYLPHYSVGRYMSSSLDDYDDADELQLFFADYVDKKYAERCQGYPVRAVRTKKK
ncbi:MAG: InlB B-repeat-containing protein [Bacteroidales bacterium]|nr:InlB B-repeat-containing protein [Candidatus Scybalocola fimicaballi]